jgi:hypothetical protein
VDDKTLQEKRGLLSEDVSWSHAELQIDNASKMKNKKESK